MNAYLKTVIAVIIPTLGSLLTALGTIYGHAWWYPVLGIATTSAITAFGVYVTPNTTEPISDAEMASFAFELSKYWQPQPASGSAEEFWPTGKETMP